MKIIYDIPHLKNFNRYLKAEDLLTKYLREQYYNTYATELYAEKIFENSLGGTVKLLISEPINFKIKTNFNFLLERNIHVGIDIPNDFGVSTFNTLYLIDNQNISKLDNSLYFYSNPNIEKYLDNIESNFITKESIKLSEEFDIINIVHEYYKDFNEHTELDNLIQKTLIKYL
jgi:sulfur relay (sulfurtransferase) DsrC/TusE family protein